MGDEESRLRWTQKLTPFEWACLGIVALAFLLRIQFIVHPDIIWDSAWYLMLARSFSEDGTFWLRWSDPPSYSGYWPPLFPIFLSPLVKMFGASYSTLVLGSVLASALLTAAVFFTTRDMMGRTRAFAAMTIIAVSPAFTSSDAHGMSESLLALMVVLTLWALLKGIDKPQWLPAALGFGFLAYLGKSNLGVPFVVAGLVAFALWIGWARGWRRTFGHPAFMLTGLAGLAIIAVLALTRTGKLGGVGLGLIQPLERASSHSLWIPFMLFKLAFAASFLLVVTLPVSLHVRKALPALDPRKDAKAGTLWMATILPLLMTAVFTASFLITERRGPTEFEFVADAFGRSLKDGFIQLTAAVAELIDFDNVRYLSPAVVPFLWLVLPHFPFERDPDAPANAERAQVRRRHTQAFGIAIGAFTLLLFLSPTGGTRLFPAGVQLDRLRLLLMLALIPLGLALFARTQWYDLSARKTTKGQTVWRYEEAKAPPVRWRAVGLILLFALLTGYLLSLWFAVVAIGLLVAFGSRTTRGTVVAMALVLLFATSSNVYTPPPNEETATWIAAHLPPGTVIGVSEPIVYFAAVAPGNMKLRLVDFAHGVQDEVDVLVVMGEDGQASRENFTAVRAWNYEFVFTPALQARLTLERDLLGKPFDVRSAPAFTLHVRVGSEAEQALLADGTLQP